MDEKIDNKLEFLSTARGLIVDLQTEITSDKTKFESKEVFDNIKDGEKAINEIEKALKNIQTLIYQIDGLEGYLQAQKNLDWKE